MTLWQKLTLGVKFLFGTFDSATDYLLNILNAYLAKTNVAEKVKKAQNFLASTLEWLNKLGPYCPNKWTDEFAKIVSSVQFLHDALDDGKLTADEIALATNNIKSAIEKWNAE